MLKGVILIGGPLKGTRFRTLSLDIPKPLFPVAGFPMIYHHIEAFSKVPGIKEILLIGYYQIKEAMKQFLEQTQQTFKVPIRYLQEYTPLGTAGGLYHFRDQILSGGPDFFFVMNSDVCCNFALMEMLEFHESKGMTDHFTIMGTEATRQQACNYGCMVEDKNTNEVLHYVEKPETFVTSTINCGIYLFSPSIFNHIGQAFYKSQEEIMPPVPETDRFEIGYTSKEPMLRLEQDILTPLANTGKLFIYHQAGFWSQIKSAGAAIYANRHYLATYQSSFPNRLAKNGENKPKIIGDVFVHPTASVDPTATLGPNVTIGKGVTIGEGVRVRESMVLEGATLQDHSCILFSIIGWQSIVGSWSRVEGTPNDPNPNKPFAKLDATELFSSEGKLNPSITVIGSHCSVPSEVVVLNSIVLPHKDLNSSHKNQIIL